MLADFIPTSSIPVERKHATQHVKGVLVLVSDANQMQVPDQVELLAKSTTWNVNLSRLIYHGKY